MSSIRETHLIAVAEAWRLRSSNQKWPALNRDHRGLSRFYYLDASMEETIRRHATRAQAAEFGPDDMRPWYRPRDLLRSVREHVIPEASTLQETISLILAETQPLQANQVCGAEDINSGQRLPATPGDFR
jgi:hypothetical protein